MKRKGEQEARGMFKRAEKNNTVAKNGEQNFLFDAVCEFRKYCFLCGEKIEKSDWKLLKEEDRFYRYVDWKDSIAEKYGVYSKESLVEFSRYLNHKERLKVPQIKFVEVFLSSFISVILTMLITEFVDLEIEANTIVEIIGVIISIETIPLVVGWGLLKLSEMLSNDNIREYFYQDYRCIINELIAEKTRGELEFGKEREGDSDR